MKPILLLVMLSAVALGSVKNLGGDDVIADEHDARITEVSDQADLVRVKTDDKTVEVFVNRNSIEEYTTDDVTVRIAHVVYHLNTPRVIAGKEIHYVIGEMAYHCKSGLYMTSKSLLLDKNADPVYKVDESSEVKEAEDRTNVWYEMKYVCGAKVKKTPKSQPESTKKYIAI